MPPTRHVAAVTEWLTIEVGFAGTMGPAALYTAIVEALKNSGILDAAGVVYLRGSGPGILRGAVDIFVPDVPDEPEEPEVPQARAESENEDEGAPMCAHCNIPLVQFAVHEEGCETVQVPPPMVEPDALLMKVPRVTEEQAEIANKPYRKEAEALVQSVEEGQEEARRGSRPDDVT